MLHHHNDIGPKYSTRPLIKTNNFSRPNTIFPILLLLLPWIQTEFSLWNLEKVLL